MAECDTRTGISFFSYGRMDTKMYTIGVLSDTHGLLREEVLAALKGCDAILHGGDINRQEILDRLEEIAPVYVVRGNNDKDWAEHLPLFLDMTLFSLAIYMTHKKKDLPGDLSGYGLVVYGHSHRYDQKTVGDTLLLNPGSCGPRRFNQEITMALVTVSDGGQIRELKRIDIPHTKPAPALPRKRDLQRDIKQVMQYTDKGKTVPEIAEMLRMDPDLAEQICRLYLTHPGVDTDGIMTKMGL